MQIVSIEPTPNPNSMRLTTDEPLPEGFSLQFDRETAPAAPPYIRQLLAIEGVKSVFQVADFIAVERAPTARWPAILAAVRTIFADTIERPVVEPPGRVQVYIQMIRGLPMQVKLLTGTTDLRFALPPRFKAASAQAAAASADFLAERKWADRGARYGDENQIGAEVVAEISAAYDDERLARLLSLALAQGANDAPPRESLSPAQVAARLSNPDWRQRYAALDQLEPEANALPVIVQALADSHAQVRRLAVVYLGQVGGAAVMPHLIQGLTDSSGAVRRAAGDCLSDLGDPAAITPMCTVLKDPSKLVRWRAARYLYEVGDATALPALREAEGDPEFEVRLQIEMAIERIAEGRALVEPAWKRMTQLD
jgi:hypothetical protein